MPYAVDGGSAVYFEEHGAGPPLMLVSGLGGKGSFWDHQLAFLSRWYRVIVHDHRGVGRSSPSRLDYSVEQMAADVVMLMDHLGIPSAHIIGHSTGGAIGQVLAQDYPSRVLSLVLSASWSGQDEHFRRVFELRKEILLRSGFDCYSRLSILFQYPPEWISENGIVLEEKACQRAFAASAVDVLVRRIDAVLSFNRHDRLGQIRCPLLVIVAEDDILTPPFYSRRISEGVLGSRLEVLRYGGHFAPRVCPDLFNGIVGAFLSDECAR